MPTKREREYYRMGFFDGRRAGELGRLPEVEERGRGKYNEIEYTGRGITVQPSPLMRAIAKPKRKLSAWNKFVKANSKKKIYQFASGKLKLKKMGIAFRKKKR